MNLDCFALLFSPLRFAIGLRNFCMINSLVKERTMV
jgi:hypothetical protein